MRTKHFKNMIFHKYQPSTRRQICSESIETFSKYVLFQYDLLMFKYFQKMISPKYPDATRRQKNLKTLGDTKFSRGNSYKTNSKQIGVPWVQI